MSNNSAKVTTQPVNGEAAIPASQQVAVNNTAIERLQQLEALFLGGPIMSSAPTATSEIKCSFSTETLLDVLMVLYNELKRKM